jgi:hypothetical protein
VTRASFLTWLHQRQPEPPAALGRQLALCVQTAPDSAFASESVAAVAGALGLTTLGAVVRRQGVAYDAAMDLLAADALVTYAFEAASEEGGDVTGLARRLLDEVPA